MSIPEKCLYCDCEQLRIRYQKVSDRLKFVSGDWDLWECVECNSLMLSPFPSPKEALSFYPNNYHIPNSQGIGSVRESIAYLEQRIFKFFFSSQVQQITRKILHKLPCRPKVLEVGCGNGSRLDLFSKLDLDIIGIDVSREDIEAVKAKGLNANLIDVNEIEKYFEPNSFDVVMSFDVLEHAPNLKDTLNRILLLLKPGGWLISGFPASDCFGSRILGKRWATLSEVPRHVSVPSIQGATRLYEMVELKDIDYFPYPALTCAMVFGMSLVPNAATNHFYGAKFKLGIWLTRIFGGLTMLLLAPLSFLENYFTKHPARFVMVGRK